jgi:hypothetical protein
MTTTLALLCACAGTPGPGDAGYAYNVEGVYAGRLLVDGERFDARAELSTMRSGRVRGTFRVVAPLEIDATVDGVVLEDLLRFNLRYGSSQRGADGRPCEGSIEGVLSVERGGGVFEGPVTITDCGDSFVGRLSFRRQSP